MEQNSDKKLKNKLGHIPRRQSPLWQRAAIIKATAEAGECLVFYSAISNAGLVLMVWRGRSHSDVEDDILTVKTMKRNSFPILILECPKAKISLRQESDSDQYNQIRYWWRCPARDIPFDTRAVYFQGKNLTRDARGILISALEARGFQPRMEFCKWGFSKVDCNLSASWDLNFILWTAVEARWCTMILKGIHQSFLLNWISTY